MLGAKHFGSVPKITNQRKHFNKCEQNKVASFLWVTRYAANNAVT